MSTWYRENYLKSQEWKSIREMAMSVWKCRCAVCGKKDLSNDVHHLRYRSHLNNARPEDLVVLCRAHHKIVHDMLEIHHYRDTMEAVVQLRKEYLMFWRTVRWCKRKRQFPRSRNQQFWDLMRAIRNLRGLKKKRLDLWGHTGELAPSARFVEQ